MNITKKLLALIKCKNEISDMAV